MKWTLALLTVLPLLSCGKKSEDLKDQTIVAYSRENNSGTYMYFKEHVLDNEDFAANVQTHPGTGALINAVSKDRRSIGYGGIGYAKGVKALAVKKDAASPAVEPTMENVVNGSYPISRYLYFYTAGQPEGAVRHFIAWCLSDEGQKICESVGYYPMPADKRLKIDNAAKPTGKHTITVKGSDTMVILGQRWAEHYMKQNPDVVVQITGGGSGTGIAALIDGATNVCQASRPMKQAEKDKVKSKQNKEAVEIAVAMDGLAVFVQEANPLKEVSLDQLKSIYTGKTKVWGDLVGTGQ